MTKAVQILCFVFLVTGCVAPAGAEDVLTDDFSREAPGRWETVWGADWRIKDGEFFTAPESGVYQKSMVVADFPMIEGTVEAEMHSLNIRSASIGLVGKYISRERCLFMRIAYWRMSIYDGWPPEMDIPLGPFALGDSEDRQAPPEEVRLKMVMRNGRIGVYANGVLRTVFRDPYPDEAGRPGLYSESTTFVSSFSARRTK